MNKIRVSCYLIAAVFITGCGPRLQQVKNYIPPATVAGVECLQQVDVDRQKCQTENSLRIEQCREAAHGEAEIIHQKRMEQYTTELENFIDAESEYEAAYAAYKEQQRLFIRDGQLAYIQCSNDTNMSRIDQFPQCKKHVTEAERRADDLAEPIAPVRPVRPSLEQIVFNLQRQCHQNQQPCDQYYDNAYVSCGGRINLETVCVANCN